jgi:hypothetical protein
LRLLACPDFCVQRVSMSIRGNNWLGTRHTWKISSMLVILGERKHSSNAGQLCG